MKSAIKKASKQSKFELTANKKIKLKTKNDDTKVLLSKDDSEITPTSNQLYFGGKSRLVVKNLPGGKKNQWDEAKLRSIFAKFGTLTDVKLKFNEKTGVCKLAFIGFENTESCQTAIKKLNGTFIKGTKIQVEECRPLSSEWVEISKIFTLNKLKKKGINKNDEEKPEGEISDDEVGNLIEKQILDTGHLFLRNLSYSTTEEQIRALCVPFGPLAEVECIVDKNGKCKGFALCTFMFPEHALNAWKALNGTIFMGRMLHVIAGEEKVKKTDQEQKEEFGRSQFQRDRQKTRKEGAAQTPHTWNALFLGANSVAETLADNYEVEKRHLLLEEGENSAAVRMAMAETRLVRETRKFLLAHGVRLDAFSRPLEGIKRSKTVILVKNLSAKPDEQEHLRKLFARFGEVREILVPSEHAISALVEMATENDAKHAFEALAYTKKLNGKPLYLEWAPSDVFDEEHSSRAILKYGYQNNDDDKGKKQNEEVTPEKEKNGEKEDPECTKILLRNVPFQANSKEIAQLFSTFGELRFVRLPKKPGGDGHRGFCFVDFLSVADARRAMESLAHSTHLYGRRLVLEWAKQNETMDELRAKTSKRMGSGRKLGAKRQKMRSFES